MDSFVIEGGRPLRGSIRAAGNKNAALPIIAAALLTEEALTLTEEIDQLESDADKVSRDGISRLFREEQDVRQLIKHKNVYEYLEEAIDKCQDVANVIESVIVENV